jgi:hypothetical protein
MILGFGLIVIILPINFIAIRKTSNTYKTLAIWISTLLTNTVIMGLYVYGISDEITSPLKFSIGICMAILFNLSMKIYLIQKDLEKNI